MTVGSTQHIILFLATAAFMVLSCLAVAKLPRKWQDLLIVISVVICSSAIFYRFAMGLSWKGGLDLKTLLMQQLQVCNFNFILLPLMLMPKFKLARQYSFYFSMFAAATTLVALNPRWGGANWYEPIVFNSWLYHSFAMICPLWMFASGRLRPERKYILPVSGCVFGYFTLVYIISEILKSAGIMAENQSFSYIYNTDGIPILSTFHELIGVPYWHLAPAFVIVVIFFFLLSLPFTRTILLVGNGGLSARAKGVKKLYGTTGCDLKLLEGGFEREGYTLVGWSDAPDGEVKYALGETITVSRKMQLYAVWEARSDI
ncbi:MAG: YwaF family protein [Clostridia bacterium]|nr:YwaF family protein [Clostridia bacterium]